MIILTLNGKHGEVFLMSKNKRYGLRNTQADVIDEFMVNSDRSMNANAIKHHLVGIWSIHSVPTPREIGSYFRINPNYERVNKQGYGSAEYIWIGN